MEFKFKTITHDTRGLAVNEYGADLFYSELARRLMKAHAAANIISFRDGNYALESDAEVDIEHEAETLLEIMAWCATRIKALEMPDEKVADLLDGVNDNIYATNYFGARSV